MSCFEGAVVGPCLSARSRNRRSQDIDYSMVCSRVSKRRRVRQRRSRSSPGIDRQTHGNRAAGSVFAGSRTPDDGPRIVCICHDAHEECPTVDRKRQVAHAHPPTTRTGHDRVIAVADGCDCRVIACTGRSRARFVRGDCRSDDGTPLPVAVGGVSTRIRLGAVTAGFSASHRRRTGRTREHCHRARLLPRPCASFTPRAPVQDRTNRGRSRHPDARDRRRAGNRRARAAEISHCAARGPSQDGSRSSRGTDRIRATVLLFQRLAARRRDRRDGVPARARLPPCRFRAADDPAHPREPGRADQSGIESGRPRQAGRMVLPVSEGQDRPRRAPAPVAAVLVALCIRGYESRRAPAGARGDAGRARHVP